MLDQSITFVNPVQPKYLLVVSDLVFGDWVRGNRMRLKLSQGALSREIGVARSYISRIESGEVNLPTEDSRDRFHKVFGTTEQDLIDLGIVPQFDEWGRPIKDIVSVKRPNPFEPQDPRHDLVELLYVLNPNGPDSKEALDLIVQFKNQISARIERFSNPAKSPAPVDIKARR